MIQFLFKKSFSSSLGLGKVIDSLGLKNKHICRNLSVAQLYEVASHKYQPADHDTHVTEVSSAGALVAYSGKRTGRSPKDKRIVLDEKTKDSIWWGEVNIPLPPTSYALLEQKAIEYLNTRPRLYVVDGYAGWHPLYRFKVRVLCTRAYHALFMRNMLIRPSQKELETDFFDGADYYIFNAGEMASSNKIEGVSSETCVAVNLSQQRMTILGTQYAGEMKKGVFGICHYIYPQKGILSLHSSANEGVNGDVTLLFGLSGTGKTTLSADPHRKLIGDDEHCWGNDGVFNIEGGCYAKCVGLTAEKEPEIYKAIKFGTVLENVNYYPDSSREVNYFDTSITENTRACYPLEYIPGAKNPAIAGHAKNVIFLTCDAYGVLPPVSKLTSEQAMYHFISGYTAKVAGTEMGVKEPQATFSACFGEAFLPLHPTLYATMLKQKLEEHNTNVWLINTGWTGGSYGIGKRIDLKLTRAILDSIHDGTLASAEYENLPVFNLAIPKKVNKVPDSLLNPINTWVNKDTYHATVKTLAEKFIKNFKKYSDKASAEILKGAPVL